MAVSSIHVHRFTLPRWPELESLFGEKGACGGCWCMWWRTKRAEFMRNGNEGNRRALKALADAGKIHGVLAYHGNEPVAWCSFGPRQDFGPLKRSRTLKSVDDLPVWAVVCFYVAPAYRRQGLMEKLLEAAANHSAQMGATVLEAYPYEASASKNPSTDIFMGTVSTFRKSGFVEVVRRVPYQAIMRRPLHASP